MLARLARAEKRDLRFLVELWNDPAVMTSVGFPDGLGVDEDIVREQVEADGLGLLGGVLIVETLDGARIGQARLGPLDADGVCETDLKLLPGAQKHGFALELKRAMLRFLFENTRCTCVRTTPLQDNLASIRLQERVHARRVAQDVWHFDEDPGQPRPYWVYELRREDWLRSEKGGEGRRVHEGGQPVTRRRLASDLRELGLGDGELVLLHASLSSLGWVCGGEHALLLALLDVVGPDGTLIVATQTSYNSDPAEWEAPPVPASWWETICDEMPAFDPARSPSRGMGRVAELLRSWPGAHRSAHPSVSFSGIGPMAEELLREHPLDNPLGEASPLGALYAADADVLLLGCGYESCTAFHLAEHRAGVREPETAHAAAFVEGDRQWLAYEQIAYDSDEFPELGVSFERERPVARARVGEADGRLFGLRSAVDFATEALRARS